MYAVFLSLAVRDICGARMIPNVCGSSVWGNLHGVDTHVNVRVFDGAWSGPVIGRS